MIEGIVIWGVVAIGASTLAGLAAGWKNREYSFWMAWCFLLPPLVLWLLIMPRNKGPRPRQPKLDVLDREDSVI